MRSIVVLIVGLYFSFATLFLPGLAWAIFPQNWTFNMGSWTIHSWQIFLAVTSAPSLLAGIAVLFFPESPKFLMSKGRNKEALEIFNRIYVINRGISSYPIKQLIQGNLTIEGNISNVAGKSFWVSFLDDLKKMKILFHKEYLRKSIHANTLQFCILMG